MIDLFTWSTPNGRKISIALEELGLDYEVHEVNISKGAQHEPDFIAISPNNKIPAIVDRDNGRSLMESGAILLYLAQKAGALMPHDENAHWQVMEWLMWQMGNFGPMLGQAHHFLFNNPGKSDYAEARYAKEAQRLYSVLDRHLADREFVAGAYSVADIAIWPWTARFERHRVDLSNYPNVKRWYLGIATRPAVLRGYDVPKRGETIPMP
jgi:GSH-dependent disulfide-bond oxidoreductase